MSDTTPEAKDRFMCRVDYDYDYDGAEGAWFNFNGTPEQFAAALQIVFEREVYRLIVTKTDYIPSAETNSQKAQIATLTADRGAMR